MLHKRLIGKHQCQVILVCIIKRRANIKADPKLYQTQFLKEMERKETKMENSHRDNVSVAVTRINTYQGSIKSISSSYGSKKLTTTVKKSRLLTTKTKII